MVIQTRPISFPATVGAALERKHGAYRPDVTEFRTSDKARVLDELHQMTRQHFEMIRTVLVEQRPALLFSVEIGPDRLHHALWAHIDETDPRHDPNSPWRHEGERYYRFLDEQIATVLGEISADAVVLVVSDHGARPMLGAVRLNELLLRAGWLSLDRSPEKGDGLELSSVNWRRTRAWASGGYCGRVYLNLAGREPHGTVARNDLERTLDELEELVCSVRRLDGTRLPVEFVRPEHVYRKCGVWHPTRCCSSITSPIGRSAVLMPTAPW